MCVVYCILACVILRVPPLKFPSPYIFSSHAPHLLFSLAPLLPPSPARFLPPLFSSLYPCLRSILTRSIPHPSLPSSTPGATLPHIIASSLPPLAPPLPHPPLATSLPPILHHSSFVPCLRPRLHVSRRPIQCTPYACLASCTVLCSAWPCMSLRHWGVRASSKCRFNGLLYLSERTPTANPVLTKSEKSDDRHMQRIRRKHGRRLYLSMVSAATPIVF